MDTKTDNSTCQAVQIFEKDLWSTEMIIFVSLEAFIASIAVVGNFIVLMVFLREKEVRRKINYYILSLAIADFCVGLIGMPLGVLPVSI